LFSRSADVFECQGCYDTSDIEILPQHLFQQTCLKLDFRVRFIEIFSIMVIYMVGLELCSLFTGRFWRSCLIEPNPPFRSRTPPWLWELAQRFDDLFIVSLPKELSKSGDPARISKIVRAKAHLQMSEAKPIFMSKKGSKDHGVVWRARYEVADDPQRKIITRYQ